MRQNHTAAKKLLDGGSARHHIAIAVHDGKMRGVPTEFALAFLHRQVGLGVECHTRSLDDEVGIEQALHVDVRAPVGVAQISASVGEGNS